MIPRAPLRFLGVVLGLWVAARAAWLWPAEPVRPVRPRTLAVALPPLLELVVLPPAGRVPAIVADRAFVQPVLRRRPEPSSAPAETGFRPAPEHVVVTTSVASVAQTGGDPTAVPIRGGADPIQPARPPSSRRLTGYAYLYARPGGGRAALGPGGQLGASQAGARIAWRVLPHVALAARVSSPLHEARGAEGAVGVDLLPVAGAPLRLSLERRVAFGHDARDAWSAYAAGGVYRALGRGVELDGYAQAGVVGVRSRDPFADAALRIGRRVALDARRALVVGAGAWGAAQPGAARVDVGPRAALSLPLGAVRATLALEARLRVAGHARPGSGAALTLAADF